MRLFTFSFEPRLTEMGVAILITMLIAGAAEALARYGGFRPEANDDLELWTVTRSSADQGKEILVVAGSSRSQLGLKLSTIQEYFPSRKLVQLSISGGSPLSILKDLANDPKFVGTVLCEILPHHTFTDVDPPEPWPGYARRSFSASFEAWLKIQLKPHWAIFTPDLSFTNIATGIFTKGRFPVPSGRYFTADRQVEMDFSGEDTAAHERALGKDYAVTGHNLLPAEIVERVRKIRIAVKQIQSRGGAVIFFQMPASGLVEQAEESRFPNATCWSVFRDGVGAPAFRYKDVPELVSFKCAEGTHLDRKDIKSFTEALCLEFVRRHLIN